MATHIDPNVNEFCNLHSNELKQARFGKTYLFSDYVDYCNAHGYKHHSNLIQFCKAITAGSH